MIVGLKFKGKKQAIEIIAEYLRDKFEITQDSGYVPNDTGNGFIVFFTVEVPVDAEV